DAQTPDRESVLDACGRKATPLLLYNRVIQSLYSPQQYAEGEGSVERSHADRAEGLYWLDRLRQGTGGTQTPDRESLLDACGRETTSLIPEFLLTTKLTKNTKIGLEFGSQELRHSSLVTRHWS